MPHHPLILTARQYAWFTLGFVLFIIYGSLVPFDFQRLSWDVAASEFVRVFWRPVNFHNRADWLANVLLFVPLGYLALGRATVDRRRRPWVPIAVILPCSIVLGTLIEFAQVWFPSRYTSPDDVVAQIIGTVIGMTCWLVLGQPLTRAIRRFWATYAVDNWSLRALPVYLFIVVAIHGMPFDLTLSPVLLKEKFRERRIVTIPFTTYSEDSLDVVKKGLINAAWFLPLGVLLAGLPGRWWHQSATAWRVLGIGFLFAAGIEVMQLLVMSRYFDSGDIITGTLGTWAGWTLMHAWQERGRAGQDLQAGRRTVLLTFWLLALLIILWEPFNFKYDPDFIAKRKVGFAPFANYYQRPFLEIANDLMQKMLLFVPLGMLLFAMTGKRHDVPTVLSVSLLLSVVFVIGQFFLPGRHPRPGDVLVQTLGAWFGCRAASRLRILRQEAVA